MEEEDHGMQQEEEEKSEEAQNQEVNAEAEVSVDYEKAIAERDEQIASLQEQVAAAAKSAVIKFDKHVAGKVFRPDELENLDSYMMKYRKYGIVELLDNKLDGVYVSTHTA